MQTTKMWDGDILTNPPYKYAKELRFAVILNGFMTNYFQRSDAFMKKKKINPQEFDCGCCGNQIYKSRLRDEVKCCYCGYINHVGKYTGRRKRLG